MSRFVSSRFRSLGFFCGRSLFRGDDFFRWGSLFGVGGLSCVSSLFRASGVLRAYNEGSRGRARLAALAVLAPANGKRGGEWRLRNRNAASEGAVMDAARMRAGESAGRGDESDKKKDEL